LQLSLPPEMMVHAAVPAESHTQGQRQIKNNDSISARVVVRRFHFIDKVVQRRSVSVANGIKILAARTAYTRAHKKREQAEQEKRGTAIKSRNACI
jgi:hypothetical protein